MVYGRTSRVVFYYRNPKKSKGLENIDINRFNSGVIRLFSKTFYTKGLKKKF